MPLPTIGRIVHYTLSSHDVELIERRRAALATQLSIHQATLGNPVEAGQVCPAVVVRRWGTSPQSSVNLQVLLDGYDTHWATSRSEGTEPGTWAWPARA